jgi:hypothetical protein
MKLLRWYGDGLFRRDDIRGTLTFDERSLKAEFGVDNTFPAIIQGTYGASRRISSFKSFTRKRLKLRKASNDLGMSIKIEVQDLPKELRRKGLEERLAEREPLRTRGWLKEPS